MRKIVTALVFVITIIFFVSLPRVVYASCDPLQTANCSQDRNRCVDASGSVFCCTKVDGGCNQMPGLISSAHPACTTAGGDCLPNAYTCSTNYGPQDCPSGEQCGIGCTAPTTAPTGGTSLGTVQAGCGTGGINTAIGCIDVLGPIETFLGEILKWAVGVGAGIAFLMIIYSGFMIMTATGDPKRMQAGKELLTSAVSGLVLIILSIFILNVIGVDILRLCKFGFGPAC